jgi:hypothetical protein
MSLECVFNFKIYKRMLTCLQDVLENIFHFKIINCEKFLDLLFIILEIINIILKLNLMFI